MPSSTLRPPSAASQKIGLIGVACFLATAWALRESPSVDSVWAALILCCSFAVPVGILERIFLRTHASPAAGLDWSAPLRPLHWGRVGVKLLGLAATLAVIGAAYRVFPHYAGDLFKPFFEALRRLAIPFAMAAPVYFLWLDGRMKNPFDGYWHVGAWLIGRRTDVDHEKIKQHALGWLVKGFFLPLMFSYLHNNLDGLRHRPPIDQLDVMGWHVFLYDLLILVDVGCIVVGYALTLRAIDSHIRSTEPTWTGWVFALACYQPFWGMMGPEYFAYRSEPEWAQLLEPYPTLRIAFSAIILGLMGVYTWASFSFGLRFSNLTHRGIITNGPYRFSKHPAYVCKNMSWWFEALPFIMPFVMGARYGVWRGWWGDAAIRCLRLIGVNLIYYIRARTEERHLSRDPVYVRYALWINEHGAFAWLGRMIPALRYRPPAGWEATAPEKAAPTLETVADALWMAEAAKASDGAETAEKAARDEKGA